MNACSNLKGLYEMLIAGLPSNLDLPGLFRISNPALGIPGEGRMLGVKFEKKNQIQKNVN